MHIAALSIIMFASISLSPPPGNNPSSSTAITIPDPPAQRDYLPPSMMAQSYLEIVQRIFEAGERVTSTASYMEFLDGNLRQYAVAERIDTDELFSLTFVEERWSKSGNNDIIDQWVVQVAPSVHAIHTELVERNTEVLQVRKLGTEGAEHVVERIAKKMATNQSPPQSR